MRLSYHIYALITSALLLTAPIVQAAYTIAVPPFLPQAEMKQAYSKLTDFLSKATGEKITLQTFATYAGYWDAVRKGGRHDMAFDTAPLIDFLVQRQGYTVLVKVPGVISQSLVTRADTVIFDPSELLGKSIATIPSPSLSGLVLYEIFSNPMRQPAIKFADNARAAVDMVIQGKTMAALIPTPIAIGYPDLNVVTTTHQLPHLAIAAAPSVPSALREKIRQALLNASATPEGRALLEMLRTDHFDPASNDIYKGHAELLKGTYGY